MFISMNTHIDHRRLIFGSLPFSGFFAENGEYFLRMLIIKNGFRKGKPFGILNGIRSGLEQAGDCFPIVGDLEGATVG